MARVEARSTLYSFSEARWVETSTQVLGVPAQIRFQGITLPKIAAPANDQYWLHCDMQVIAEPQETLRNEVRRFKTEGQIVLSLRGPIVDSKCQTRMDVMGEYLRDSFRTYQGENMEFTNARIWDNVSPEANWLRINILSNFTYRQFL